MSPSCSGLARKLYENADQVSLNHYMTLLLALVIDSALSMDFFFNSTTDLMYVWPFDLLYIFLYNFMYTKYNYFVILLPRYAYSF